MTKIKKYGGKSSFYSRGLNVPENSVECEYFTISSNDSLLVYENKYYLQLYLDNCANKIVNKQMTNYLDDKLS